MLDVKEITDAATQLTGLSEVSDDAVYVGLKTFVDSLNAEAPLNEGGWERVSWEEALTHAAKHRTRGLLRGPSRPRRRSGVHPSAR